MDFKRIKPNLWAQLNTTTLSLAVKVIVVNDTCFWTIIVDLHCYQLVSLSQSCKPWGACFWCRWKEVPRIIEKHGFWMCLEYRDSVRCSARRRPEETGSRGLSSWRGNTSTFLCTSRSKALPVEPATRQFPGIWLPMRGLAQDTQIAFWVECWWE